MAIKLFDAELKVMDILWREGATTAKRLAEILGETVGWSKTTTYTVIKKCIDKDAIERKEPNFICHPLVTIDGAREYETAELINKMYYGAADQLVASILDQRILSKDEIERLKQKITDMENTGEV
ncbi:MAG: BlaI/MecI/CopY family transcriptional regulator [Oscillospiraceae bacterium]|nr:BlaI/MecI/CopY family transcriptional regulator [Oscillospiraceae bacterium]MCL2277929.1 BlaI/MecI/CopY family transcriptional regulator [Oscillospiraceae bacterium]